VVAGIICKRKFIYDLWGASVNLAARMESYGEPNRINVSQFVVERLRAFPEYSFEERPEREIKGFVRMKTYFIN
ncbi:MAG: adenylate/guanylate cyclase domain-containing protein, partial [Treponema sp.]|nr:adenylate/guanylate cyclase domain-containing protein [Treponema sp.]